MVHFIEAAANSFSDLGTPNRSHKPSREGKNLESSNEFTDFTNFDVEKADRTKTMPAIRPVNSPTAGITLENRALRVTLTIRGAPQSNEIRASEDP